MLPAKNHPSLCAHHARQEHRRRRTDGETQADELLASIPDFTTAASINLFLGNLVRQFARKRIARRDAIAMAYLGQLLLNSLSALNRELDTQQAQEGFTWHWSERRPQRETNATESNRP